MKLKLMLLILALSLCAAAQTTSEVPGIALSGSVFDPVLENHSGKTVIAALVVLMDANYQPWISYCMLVNTTPGLSDGNSARACGKREAQAKKLKSPIVSSSVNAVIFADGEFRGRDSAETGGIIKPTTFRSHIEKELQAMRHAWEMAKSGDWDGVKALHDNFLNPDVSGHGVVAAEFLLSLKDKQGSDKAVSSLSFLGSLPTTTWSDAPRAWSIPALIRAVAEWAMPTVHAQSPPFCCTYPWPQSGSIDSYHPNPWTYSCTTYTGHNNPCPASQHDAPPEGIKAFCENSTPNYEIGDKITISMDVTAAVLATTSAGVTTDHQSLDNRGVCYFYPFGNVQHWIYDEPCNGFAHPIKIVDETDGSVCGVSPLGWGE